jgi:diguanylate cyclase (GGDEF)-like protein/PAS domain S-box-containing protein
MLESSPQPADYESLLDQYEALLDRVPAIVYIADPGEEGPWIYVSAQIEAILGFTPEEWTADPHLWASRLHPADRREVLIAERNRAATGSRQTMASEYRMLHRDGHVVWIRDDSVLVHDQSGALRWHGVLSDITVQKQAEDELKRRADAQSAVARLGEHALERVSISQLLDEALISVTQVLEVEAAMLAEALPDGDSIQLRAHHGWTDSDIGELRSGVGANTQAGHTLRTGEPVVVDDWASERRFEQSEPLRRRNICSSVCVRIEGPNRPFGIFGVLSRLPRAYSRGDIDFIQSLANVLADALQRQYTEEKIEHQALHDPLTGLPNRVLFLDRVEQAFERVRRRGHSLAAVLFIDLDHFKQINDTLGHHAGDELLAGVAVRLREAVRPTDTVARFGGDEFGLLLDDIDNERDAIATAERISASFAHPYVLAAGSHFVTASIGIALSDGRELPLDLIRDADAAMYRAKERGRARYEMYDQEMRSRAVARLRLENDLLRALDGDELQLAYQPLVSLRDESIVAVEALLRWQHPQRGLVPPADFVTIAEESGLIDRIGGWVLEEASRDLAVWSALMPHGRTLGVSVNVSVLQLAGSRFVQQIQAILETSGIEPSLLSLELSETVLRDEAISTRQSLYALDRLGARLVVDDFGTGYSSLSELTRLPIASLKIDRSFVTAMGKPGAGAVAEAAIALARSLSIEVIAEGVESPEQVATLRRLGCHHAQGHLFSPAVPAAEITAMVRAGGVPRRSE